MPGDYYADGSAVGAPATRATPVLPNDVTPLPTIPKAIFVGTAGTIVGQLLEDTADRTFKVGAGYHPLRFKLIKSTGTSAADIVALN